MQVRYVLLLALGSAIAIAACDDSPTEQVREHRQADVVSAGESDDTNVSTL